MKKASLGGQTESEARTQFWGYQMLTKHDAEPNAVNDVNLVDLCDRIKAIGQLSISATAKLVGITVITTGIRSAPEIAAMIGVPKSTVYRALSDVFEHAADLILTIPTIITRPTSENLTHLTDENENEKHVSLVSPVRISEPESSCARDITTRATKELPSEVSSYEEVDSPSSVPPTSKTKPAKASARGSRLPNDWQLPNDWRQWTRINFVTATDEMVDAEAEHFRDYWIAKTGSTATKLDWQATWRNWCRNSKTLTRINAPYPYSTGRMAFDEKRAAGAMSWQDERRRKAREIMALANGEAHGHG